MSMNPKESIYLDTSVPSAYYDEEKPERMRITCGWWANERGRFEVLISEVTVDELEATSNIEKRKKFAKLVESIEVLKINEESQALAEEYIKNGVFWAKDFNDALHIAIATVNKIDIVVSWNFEDMVNHETRIKVKAINLLNGYREVNIESPRELGGEKYV